MIIQNHMITLRLDATTDTILNDLVGDCNFNKSQVIRQSIRLMKELTEFQKKNGELKIITSKGEQLLVLIS